MFHDFRERQAIHPAPQRLDQPDESRDLAACPRRRIPQRSVIDASSFLQLLDAARADAARGKVDDAQQRVVVVGVLHQAQIGERMLDLLPLEEAQAAVHAIGKPGRHQRVFQHARLGVGTVQQRHLGQVHALARERPDFLDDESRLVHIRLRFVHAQFFTAVFGRPQILAQPVLVVGDQRVGGVEDVAVRAVVLLQLDHAFHMEIAQQLLHVAHVRATEGVNGLVVVANSKD